MFASRLLFAWLAVAHSGSCEPTRSDSPESVRPAPQTTHAGTAGPIRLNEIRVTQPGTDWDEYVEIVGPPGASLEGLAFIVLGDGVGGSGCVEEIVPLDGHRIAADGLFLIAQPTLTLGTADRPPDLVVMLNLENHDNLTHLLVRDFGGELGMDLDLNDDGILDLRPWSEAVDAVATVTAKVPPTPGAEWWYAAPIGPKRDGTTPYHIRRDPLTGRWRIGPDDPLHGLDTPGGVNTPGPVWLDAPGDINGDGAVDQFDLWLLMEHWGQAWRLGDFDGDGIVGLGDLTIVLVNWGLSLRATRSED